jgi:nitrate/nitrite transporter NarK
VTFALAAEAFPTARGTVSGVLGMASALGAAGLPVAFGAVLDAAGPAALIRVTVSCAVLLLVLAALAAHGTSAGPAAAT